MFWKISTALGWAIVGLTCLGMTAWGALAIYYSNIPWVLLRHALSLAFIAGSLALFLLVRPRRLAIICFFGVFAVLLLWWFSIPPSHERDWQADVAVLPHATIEGDRVTIHNMRNIDYRSEADYTVDHYDGTFDLKKLQSVDLFLATWGAPAIAHTIMSFGFGDDQYVAVSIETRKEKGEDYSAIKGFFRQYELTYVVGDERDVIRLRANYRGENVYLYRLNTPPRTIRSVFLDYVKRINQLKEEPEWYNALALNCTTAIRGHVPYAARSPWSWKLLLNGYLDELIYENGTVTTSLPFAELKRRSLIDEASRSADKDPEYSSRIREGVPGFGKNREES